LQLHESGAKKISTDEFFIKFEKKKDAFYKRHRLGDFIKFNSHDRFSIGDFGCGTGNNALMLAGIYPNATIDCYDISQNALQHLQRTVNVLGIKNINLYQKDIMTESFDKKYDLIFSLGVMHHTQNIGKTFTNITSTLKEGGQGIFFLYNFYGKLYEVLTNRLVLILANNNNKHKILEDGKFNRGPLSTRLAPLIELLALEHGNRLPFTLKSLIRNIIPAKKAPRESNWDAFAHEIAHFVDAEFIEGLVKNFPEYELWFGGQKPITYAGTKQLLKRANLQNYISETTDFMSLVKINECLNCPRSTYFYVRK
jgi:SAM-dependent methyltransferase